MSQVKWSKLPRDLQQSAFIALCRSWYLPDPVPEYQFHAKRKWKFDWAWPTWEKVALEIEGGIYGTGKPCPKCKRRGPGGHSSVTGVLRDIEKYNAATVFGWRVLRCTPQQIDDGTVFGIVKEIWG